MPTGPWAPVRSKGSLLPWQPGPPLGQCRAESESESRNAIPPPSIKDAPRAPGALVSESHPQQVGLKQQQQPERLAQCPEPTGTQRRRPLGRRGRRPKGPPPVRAGCRGLRAWLSPAPRELTGDKGFTTVTARPAAPGPRPRKSLSRQPLTLRGPGQLRASAASEGELREVPTRPGAGGKVKRLLPVTRDMHTSHRMCQRPHRVLARGHPELPARRADPWVGTAGLGAACSRSGPLPKGWDTCPQGVALRPPSLGVGTRGRRGRAASRPGRAGARAALEPGPLTQPGRGPTVAKLSLHPKAFILPANTATKGWEQPFA